MTSAGRYLFLNAASMLAACVALTLYCFVL
jgi:hypothetical protein